MHGVPRDARFRPRADSRTRVRIWLEMREIATRDIKPDSVALCTQIAERSKRNPSLVNLARFHQQRLSVPVAVSHPKLPFGDKQRTPIRINIDQLCKQVRV